MPEIPEEVLENFREGHDKEEYLVADIKTYLRTPEHKSALDALDLSIEDVLNGRTPGEYLIAVDDMLKQWNATLGFHCFGSE